MASPTKAHQRYRNKDGQIVPGTTTVIGLLAKPALIPWAWRLGMQGEDMNKVRDLAASIGTCTHYMVESFLNGESTDLSHFTPFTANVAEPLLKSFIEWHGRQELETLAVERQLVSEKWQFGGCLDWVAVHYGEVTLFDIKTSKGIYDEYRIQLAAYKEAWNEVEPNRPITKVNVVHLDKETGDLSLHPFSDLTTEFEIFKHLRRIYVLQKRLDPKRDRSQSKGYRRNGKLSQAARRR